MELCLHAQTDILHPIHTIPACSFKLSCLSSPLFIKGSPTLLSLSSSGSEPPFPFLSSSPGFLPQVLCWKKVFIDVVFICVSAQADSPRAAAAAAWALPWGTLWRGGGWQQAEFPKALPHKGLQETWEGFVSFRQWQLSLPFSLLLSLSSFLFPPFSLLLSLSSFR